MVEIFTADKYYFCGWKQNTDRKKKQGQILCKGSRRDLPEQLASFRLPRFRPTLGSHPWRKRGRRGRRLCLRASSAVCPTLCGAACAHKRFLHPAPAPRLWPRWLQRKARTPWPSELRTTDRAIFEHLPTSWVITDKTHSPSGKQERDRNENQNQEGRACPSPAFRFSSAAAGTRWPATETLVRLAGWVRGYLLSRIC